MAGTINGTDNNDTINGGTGNDTLSGGKGDDLYQINSGFGNLTIADNNNQSMHSTRPLENTIQFGAGLNAADASFIVSGNDLVIKFQDQSGSITLPGTQQTLALPSIAKYKFADGTVLTSQDVQARAELHGTSGNDVLTVPGAGRPEITRFYGEAGNDTLTGGTGNATLSGGTGDDLYLINSGFGNLTLIDNNNQSYHSNRPHENTIQFGAGLKAEDASFIVNGNTIVVKFKNQSGSITMPYAYGTLTIPPIENYKFADGTVLHSVDRLELQGTSGNDVLSVPVGAAPISKFYGYAGNDVLDSRQNSAVSSYFEGGAGNDTIYGGYGNDTYAFTSGWGSDTIWDASGNNTLDLSVNNSSMQINLAATAGDHTNSASSDIFWTGEVIQNVYKGIGNDVITGTSVDNFISAGAGNDTINAGAGNDTLDGGAGNDRLIGETGDDLYIVDSTTDVIVENANEGTDTVQSSATYVLSSNVENLTLTGTAAINGSGNTQNNVLIGNTGTNALSGGAGNDTLDGNTGADILKGGSGNDTYLFSLGDGFDSVQEADNTAGNVDTLSFDASVVKADIALFMSGNDLQIGYKNNATDQITVVNQQLASGSIERFQANDGTYLTNADVNLVIQQMSSYATANGVSFTSLSDVENNANLMAIVNGAWHTA